MHTSPDVKTLPALPPGSPCVPHHQGPKRSERLHAARQPGLTAGLRVYSQAMENEADHLGLFILKEGGYCPKDASHSHVRLLNEQKSVRQRSDKPRLLYERSVPGSRERIQELVTRERSWGNVTSDRSGKNEPNRGNPFQGFRGFTTNRNVTWACAWTLTGSPSFFPGSNFHCRTASIAFSSRP